MNIKAKKENEDGMVRLETQGKIQEVLIKEDFLKPKEATVSICFRGKKSSGIVELTAKEIEDLYRNIHPRLEALKGTKVLKFEK